MKQFLVCWIRCWNLPSPGRRLLSRYSWRCCCAFVNLIQVNLLWKTPGSVADVWFCIFVVTCRWCWIRFIAPMV